MRGSLITGILLTAAVTAGMRCLWGDSVILPGLSFGLLATLIQLVAVQALRRRMQGTTTEFFRGLSAGMALRMAGVIAFAAAVLVDPIRFAAVPTAFGYLGVLIPLLFLEARFVR